MTPEYWEEGITFLSQKDSVLQEVLQRFSKGPILERRSTPFIALARSITGQQISVKAAASIWERLELFCDGDIQPAKIIPLSVEDFRSLGFSNNKSHYIQNIAHYCLDKLDTFWDEYDSDLLKKELLAIKGVGEWTYQMFAIFFLLEPNIFPIKDIAILRAIGEIYNLNEKTKTGMKKIERLSRRWAPYNTVATYYLWRHLDGIPVNY